MHQIQNNLDKSVILTDSLSSLQTLSMGRASSRQYLVNECRSQIGEIQQKEHIIKLVWIPSHIGIIGNGCADRSAKEACRNGIPLTHTHTLQEVISIIRTKIRTKFEAIWASDSFKYKDLFDPPTTEAPTIQQ